MDSGVEQTRELLNQITINTDTRDILAHETKFRIENGFDDWTIVDVDAHHSEMSSWREVVEYLDDPILKHFFRKTSTRDGVHPDGYEGMSLEELNEYVELYESQIKEFNEEESDTAGKGKYRNLNKNDMRKPRR